jgi:beta-lactam-binding protein with PASTA domain
VGRRTLIGLVAAGVILFAAGAVVIAARVDESDARTVTVPQVTGTGIRRAYALARAAGFRLAVSNRFSLSALCEPIAERQVPPIGASLRDGGVITIRAGGCPIASPGVRMPMPTAAVPDFRGKLASEVVAWADTQAMFWSVRGASALAAGSAPALLGNYRVIRQSPRAGARLRPGVLVRSGGGSPRGFRVTPITVWVGYG